MARGVRGGLFFAEVVRFLRRRLGAFLPGGLFGPALLLLITTPAAAASPTASIA